ncbi:ABC transporter ATP-binding protein [Amycolatopsis sp. NBC_01480]|uniref:ABC transporter ATP-binding protein n=1 Tax=Amycolatopsis sp. NBC_01480 TaxID=2903562 RepID=UPI002E29E05C|nr:ABC transporter ATP-binding protein [Amycolatopsis sp. NBC_01480]
MAAERPGPARIRSALPGYWLVIRLSFRHCPVASGALTLCAVLTAVLPAAFIILMAVLTGLVPGVVRAGLDSAAATQLWHTFAVAAVVLLGAMVVDVALDSIGSVVAVRLTYSLQRRLASALNRLPDVSHLEHPEVTTGLAIAQGALTNFAPAEAPLMLLRIMSNRLSGILACIIVATWHWWLGLLLLCAWQAVRVPLRRIIARQTVALQQDAALVHRARYFARVATSAEFGKEVRVFRLASWLIDRYRTLWLDGMREVWRARTGLTQVVLLIGGVMTAVYLLVCWFLADAALTGELSLTRIGLLAPSLLLTSAVGGISYQDIALEWMSDGLQRLERLNTRLDRAASALSGSRPAPAEVRTAIEFSGVRFSYPKADRAVFDGLCLTIPAGRSTAIVGSNGAGKSTLVKLLARLYDPVDGRILVDGADLSELDARQWQQRIALITQDFLHLPLSVRDNIAFAAADEPGIRAALAKVGAVAFVGQLPDGLDSRLAPSYSDGVGLSGGQWQRIALARAVFALDHGATVLVLDEPAAALDVRAEAAFYRDFLDLTRGVTTVLISHRFATVRLADHIHVLGDTGVTESGTHDELVAAEGQYAQMYRLQAERFAVESP